MPRINTLGDIATGYSGAELGLNGAVVAATTGFDINYACWLTDTEIAFQKNTTVSELWKYNTGSSVLTKIDNNGATGLGAGNGIWVAWLPSGIRTSLGGTVTGALLGGVDELGNYSLNSIYQTARGVRAYDTTGAQLFADDSIQLVGNAPASRKVPCRNGYLMYCTSAGWQLRQVDGTVLSSFHTINPVPHEVMPVATSGGVGVCILESTLDPTTDTNRLVLRARNFTTGYVIRIGDCFFPDAYEISTNVVRIAWTTTSGERADSLMAMDLNIITGANRTATVIGGVLTWQDNAPIPLTTGVSTGTFVGDRHYRVRYVEINSDGVILRRSEPSINLDFTPSDTGAGATITRPALINEGETHWELEAADDLNPDTFWRIQTIPIATTTTTDDVDLTNDSYENHGPVSEEIGTYLLQSSAKFVLADADRLITMGHWDDLTKKCRVAWSPVYADPGVGNDERLPLATGGDNYVDLDNFEGGEITGGAQMSNGIFFVFKWSAVWRFNRTGDITHAYDPICISKVRGAIPDSIVPGIDEAGRPCIYFLDPAVGPCMVGAGGTRDIAGLRNTWRTVVMTQDAITVRSLYYKDKQQVHWWLATGDAVSPNKKIVLHVNYIDSSRENAVKGSWVTADGLISTATAVAVWHEVSVEDDVERLRARPFIGLPSGDDVDATEMLQRCDVNDTDNGVAYFAKISSKPFLVAGLLNNWGSMACALLATATEVGTLLVSCIRDYGSEQTAIITDLDAAKDESFVIKKFDQLSMSEARAIQFQFEDPPETE